jgi:phosphatidylserine decarboxylase
MGLMMHQYIDRSTGKVRTERLLADRMVNFIYSEVRENVPRVFEALTSARGSSLLGYLNFDTFLGTRFGSAEDLLRRWGVDVSECLDEPAELDTPTKLFTRRIKYWDCRPMPQEQQVVVSPADARVLLGSFETDSLLFIKEKFFEFSELLGSTRPLWLETFQGGDFAVFRLTPDKYHYNHSPVAGRVLDIYELSGDYHSCNPQAVVSLVTPYSKNKRVVTILDTDLPGGTGVGVVAMVEVVALMVGDIEQCYSSRKYDYPIPVKPGIFLEKGQPKSLFRPGSSTVILMFEPGRIGFDQDLVNNQFAMGVASRFSEGFGRPLVETDLQVRARIGQAVN